MRLGLIVILVGVLFFLKNIGIINSINWDILWPVLVMLIGVSMVLRKRCSKCGGWGCKWCEGKHAYAGICSCMCNSCQKCDKAC